MSPKPPLHPNIKHGYIGVLLVNLGTPDATNYWSIRRYLKQFLSDRRVIELPPLLWKPLLNCFVLSTRPQKTAKAYRTIWIKDTNESPLRKFTRQQSQKLAVKVAQYQNIIVDWAMRYGTPSIPSRLTELHRRGCDRILIFALYPQYSAATTATVHDQVMQTLLKMRRQPAIRTVPPFHDNKRYIQILSDSITNSLKTLTWTPDLIITSFHGLPQNYFDKGDPYYCHCQKTARLLRQSLTLDPEKLLVTFQSRFGPQEWLKPYTDQTLIELPKKGIKKLVIVTPGFFSDCLETLEEIAIQGQNLFLSNGGTHYAYIPCLNDTEDALSLLQDITLQELSGWI